MEGHLRFNTKFWVLLAAVVVVLIAILVVGIMSGGKVLAQPYGEGSCKDKMINHYVSEPDINSSGKATHSLEDIFGNSYGSGSYVIGWWVKETPGAWDWRSGRSMWVDEGQTVKACIAQKAYLYWTDPPSTATWVVISPEKFR